MLTLEKGDALIRKGDALNQIYLVVDGSTQAHIQGRHLTAQSTSADAKFKRLGGDSGAWVGEMAFLDRLGDKERQKISPKKNDRQKSDGEVKGAEEASQIAKAEESIQRPSEASKEKSGPGESVPLKKAVVLYTVLAKEDCQVWKWSFEDMESLMSSSIVRVS